MWPRVDGLRAFGLGRPGAMRDRLNDLVMDGVKTATAGLWSHEYDGEDEPLEDVGERQVLLDSAGAALAVVEVTRVEVHRFVDVPWEFALAEGEGFESVEHWRSGHREYYAAEGIAVGDDDLVACVWLRVVEDRRGKIVTMSDGRDVVGGPIRSGEGGEATVGEPVELPDQQDDGPRPRHVNGALMLSFGAVVPGREALAVETFTAVSRYFGELLADDVIESFKPFFFDGGMVGDIIGFFLLEGQRDRLDELRHRDDFRRLLLRAGAATANVRLNGLVAGTEAGRTVNLYRTVREELGLLG